MKELSVNLITLLSLKNSKPFDMTVLKVFIPMLMNGTREKDASVRLRSEVALVNMLHLKEGDELYKVFFNFYLD